MNSNTLFAFPNFDHQVLSISSKSGCMGVDFLLACMGRVRYVNRYKMYTGVGRQAKRDARHKRLVKISQVKKLPRLNCYGESLHPAQFSCKYTSQVFRKLI